MSSYSSFGQLAATTTTFAAPVFRESIDDFAPILHFPVLTALAIG